MKILEIKNNLYQPVGIVLSDGTQLNIPKRSKRSIKEEFVYKKQLDNLVAQDKIKIKEINKEG